jgi:uncharacterized protein YggE
MTRPNTVAVNIELTREIPANGVHVFVEVQGSSLVTGRAALRKAKEVHDLVQKLSALNIEDDQIELVGVRAEVTSGMISRSSSAHYSLKIKLPDLDLLADTLGILMSSKNATIGRLHWKYDRLEETHHEMLKEAVARAEARVSVICEGLSHRKLRVHNMTEKVRGEGPNGIFPRVGDALLEYKVVEHGRRMTKEDLGLEISHSKTVGLEMRVEYEVEPLNAEAAKPNTTSG